MQHSNSSGIIRVLIVDDDEDDFFITSEYIREITTRSFQIDWCSTYPEALKNILSASYDIYFIDYRLNIKTGIDLLKEAMLHQCEEPIILLTGKGNQKIDMEAMRLGAVDYLIKSDLNSEKLERCIRYALERSATLKRLRASERQYRNIFEKTNDVIFIADYNLQLQNVNRAASILFGHEAEELKDLNLCDLFTLDEDKETFRNKLLKNGKIDDQRIELTTKDGENKICIVSASVEADQRGNNYIQGIIHDITLLKKAEEITVQSEKLEAKGRVIRTLAHEVRNPLNNINLSLENLKGETTEQAFLFIDIIQRNSKRIEDLINELMDSSRYYKMKMAVMPLQLVMDEAINRALDRIALHKIKLNLDYSPTPAFAMVDKEKMKIAFLNIIINAIEAMKENEGVLHILILNKTDFHEVLIKDNGCGMDPETANRLFEPYFTSKPNGLGLGLATTHAIIQSHKASIDVSSKPNEGTTFTIRFTSLK
jgi:PAS domain S-box-containing protein